MNTYESGDEFFSTRVVYKGDIIDLCDLLKDNAMFRGICTFEPEPISEGGLIYRFINPPDKKWYKTVRLSHCGILETKWPWIDENVMLLWRGNYQDIIFKSGATISTFLKAFGNAPSFTEEEKGVIEEAFRIIGLVKTVQKKKQRRKRANK